MRVAVYGGTFDPPHNMHLAIARAALDRGLAGRVLFVPVADPPHKEGSKITPYRHRFAMLSLAVKGEGRFEVSKIEAERLPLPSYTIDTMDALSAASPDDNFILLIGSDSLDALHTWMRAKELAGRYEIAVYPRPGQQPSLEKLLLDWPESTARKLYSSIMKDMAQMDLSSTWLRSELANSQNAGRFIPTAVLDYIRDQKLYGTV